MPWQKQGAAFSMGTSLASLPPTHLLLSQVELVQAVEDAGFDARALGCGDAATLTLSVSGMVCSSCVGAVEEALTRHQGVIEARVNLLAGRAEVRLLAGCHKEHFCLVLMRALAVSPGASRDFSSVNGQLQPPGRQSADRALS